jgi:hypothetical protein
MGVFLGTRAKALWQLQIEQLYKKFALAPATWANHQTFGVVCFWQPA